MSAISTPANLDSTVRQLVDRLHIQSLVYNYNHALDRRDENLFATLWAPDATCGDMSGAAAILEALRKTAAKYADLSHLTSNLVITLQGDRATARSKSVIRRATAGQLSAPLVCVSYEDEFVRLAGVWKIMRRTFIAHSVST